MQKVKEIQQRSPSSQRINTIAVTGMSSAFTAKEQENPGFFDFLRPTQLRDIFIKNHVF